MVILLLSLQVSVEEQSSSVVILVVMISLQMIFSGWIPASFPRPRFLLANVDEDAKPAAAVPVVSWSSEMTLGVPYFSGAVHKYMWWSSLSLSSRIFFCRNSPRRADASRTSTVDLLFCLKTGLQSLQTRSPSTTLQRAYLQTWTNLLKPESAGCSLRRTS